MKYIQFLMLSFSCLATTFASAQSFKKGHIYLLNGDTLNGYIADGNYEALSRSINFKNDKKNDDLITYLPNGISGFQFSDGDYFKTGFVQFSAHSISRAIQDVSEIRFLHRLYANGKTSLYELNNGHDNPLFLQKGDGPLKLLCLDRSGNLAYLEELAFAVKECETVIVPADLPLDSKAIQAVLTEYDHCGQHTTPAPVPQAMAWAGISFPVSSLVEKYNGLGRAFQMEFRPVAEGFFSNVSLGAAFLSLNANRTVKDDLSSYTSAVKYREFSLKASFFLNALDGHLRPYGFIEVTSTTTYKKEYNQISSDDAIVWGVSERESSDRILRPGVGIHAQWKRHFIRLESPIAPYAQPRIGYGFAF
ncbi:MAG: hypothetical protein IPN76_03665 [Saprospiraceae bacterium]|nr:hypothetical protein [Saprospiraceae bacterium]